MAVVRGRRISPRVPSTQGAQNKPVGYQEHPDAIRIVLENADDIKSVAAICAKWYVDMIAYAHSNWDGPTVEETIRCLGARAATDDEGNER